MTARLTPHLPPITLDDIMLAMQGQLALQLEGIKASEFEAYLGLAPGALKEAARLAAEQEFDDGDRLESLKGTSAEDPILDALDDTAVLFFRTGMVLAYVAAGLT